MSGFSTSPALAQSALEFSTDGYRWVEFEVTVFRNHFLEGYSDEISNRERLQLNYLPRLKSLATASSSLSFPFPADQVISIESNPALVSDSSGTSQFSEVLPEITGYTARFSPALPGAFIIIDQDRDPFIELPAASHQFGALQRRLEAAPDYQVLWHQAWRQPLVPRSQVASVLIQAGEMAGEHHELEGSIRFSDNGAGLAQVDLNVWLNIFSQVAGETARQWKLPDLPVALRPESTQAETSPLARPVNGFESAVQLPEPLIEMVWQQETTRDIGGNLLYYLDHPVIGVLIQARSYLLPVIEFQAAAEDF